MSQMDREVIKAMNKLFAAGADTDRKVTAFTVQDMLALPGITVTEVKIITDLQTAIKKRAVIRFLSGAEEEKENDSSEKEKESEVSDGEGKSETGDETGEDWAVHEGPSFDEANGFPG